MHKPLGFEVMHFILYVRMWLHQGFPVEQSLQQGYARCCRMSGGESQKPDGTTPIPEDIADSTGDAGQCRTRSQSRNAGPSGTVQSITATIDHTSLATAMSHMNLKSSGNLDKGVQCCKPQPLPMGRSVLPRACRQDILHRSYLMG